MIFAKPMSRRLLIIAAFILASVLDVRVKAIPVELPSSCIKHVSRFKACAYLNDKTKRTMHLAFGDLRMSSDASLVIDRSPNQASSATMTLHLVRGVFWLRAHKPVIVKTLYGAARLTKGSALIFVQDRYIDVTNLTSNLVYQPRGEKAALPLPKGMVVRMARISQSGVARTGFPHAAVVRNLLKTWAQVYAQNDLSHFKQNVKAFLPNWVSAISAVGPWYRQVVERELASARAEKERLARRRAKERAENQKLRDLFRAENFIGVNPNNL